MGPSLGHERLVFSFLHCFFVSPLAVHIFHHLTNRWLICGYHNRHNNRHYADKRRFLENYSIPPRLSYYVTLIYKPSISLLESHELHGNAIRYLALISLLSPKASLGTRYLGIDWFR